MTEENAGKMAKKEGLELFKELYPKFINGKKWLTDREARGIDTKKDMDDFFDNIFDPLDKLIVSLNPEDRKHADQIIKIAEGFGAKRMKFVPGSGESKESLRSQRYKKK